MFSSLAPSRALFQWVSHQTGTSTSTIFVSDPVGSILVALRTRLPSSIGLTPVVMLSSGASRRCFANHYTNPLHYKYNLGTSQLQQQQRLRQNVSRLYARRILEIAAAAAATQKFLATASMESIAAAPKPIDWKNWTRKEWSQELMQSMGDGPLTRLWAAACRVVSLSVLAAPLTVLYPLSFASTTAERFTWQYALWGIEQAGPTFIKLVQWATTRQDLFSPEFCVYFGKLQDETVGHAWKETARILRQDLGIVLDRNNNDSNSSSSSNEYLELDHTPIGSGCIAQVYRGKLKQAVGQYAKGTEVAIKVQHPNIWQKVCADFYIMGMVAEWLEALPWLNLKYLSLADTVRQFRDVMLPQLGTWS